MAKYEGFQPAYLKSINSRSYRSFYKWGDKDKFYFPSNRSRIYEFVRDALGLSDEFFKEPNYADETVNVEDTSSNLDNKDIDALRDIVGEENVHIDLDARISASITKNDDELTAMHKGILPPLADAVVCPGIDKEVSDVLAYAKKRKINVQVGSTLLSKKIEGKTIVLDLSKRHNRILEFSEVDSYVKVEAGMRLPILEDIMNNAPDNFKDFNIENKYTIAHFPLEYEECTLYDAYNGFKYGSDSGYYAGFDDIVVDREYLTDKGVTNKPIDGAILSNITLRLIKYYPHNKYGFSYMFRNWQDAVNAVREMYSKNTALPVHVKLSDPKETELLMRYYMLDDTPVDSILKMYKCEDKSRCLLVGFAGGAYTYSRLAFNLVKKIAKKYKAKYLTSFIADAYQDSRFREMYARETMQDFGISTTSEYHKLSWSELPDKYKDLTEGIESGFTRSRVICPTAQGLVLEVVKMKI